MKAQLQALKTASADYERKIKKLETAKRQYKTEWVKAMKYVYQLEHQKNDWRENVAGRDAAAVAVSVPSLESTTPKSEAHEEQGESDMQTLEKLKAVAGKLAKLVKEKEVLIASGVYSEDDRLIQELNTRIRELSV
jgi:hypothetical protein